MPTFTVYKGSESGKITKAQTTRDLQGDAVLVKVTASGVCGTDEHYKHADMALGHEGVGVVEEVGSAVRTLKKGDRVGWGYEHDSCGECEYCLTGREQYCPDRKIYGMADFDQGSFASHGVWREAFLFKIPDAITDIDAAPLMCGGATVFNALTAAGVKPTDRVGIMGVGGLGHLAIQFAAKMGCDVVVLSGTDSKKDEALKLGASDFIAMKGKDQIDVGKKIDSLIITTSAMPDWKVVLPALAPTASILPLTVSEGDFSFPQNPLILGGHTVYGIAVSPRAVHRQMLAFAAHHNIKPVVMKFPMSEEGIEDCMGTLRDGKMRYRGVLVPQQA
ncbi:GroES-like protein [Bimuria novae-zelandiae CBS 107.79]|uniref:GroES-like protein n=1 Tax=Bimuria novae-zelandiae CBS 107.79 TaxID=1447943 RepID=A0A6A5UP80_9PLEO|nr:GroES-like protein [Bimuria novae-zelandiae CBS 107.79]